MGLFKSKELKQSKEEYARLKEDNERLKEMLGLNYVEKFQVQKLELEKELADMEQNKLNLQNELKNIQKDVVVLNDEILMQSFGLYEPLYDFANSELYKEKLQSVRNSQKAMIKIKSAVRYFDDWIVDGSKAKGKKMTNDNIKQIIRTFNVECESVVEKVKFNNIESIKKRIEKSFNDLNKINESNRVELTHKFLDLKIEELNLAYEYQVKKQEEKEEQKQLRERLKEEAKLQKELEEAKKNITKDLTHFNNALNDIINQLTNTDLSDEERNNLLLKQTDIENKINKLNEELKDVDYRQSNQKAGYIYVISNIGAFGENIYKIGMTRRLNPQERIDELGSASVPFNFDVHAMIFTEDAPALENALHKSFDDKKVNMVNKRKEFFNVTLDEIKEVIKSNYDKTVEFKDIVEAEQYRESLKLK